MDRTHRPPRDFSELPTAWFAVPALLWAVVIVAALLGAPSEGAAPFASTPAVATSVEGA